MMSRCPAPHQTLTATRTVYIGRAAPHSTYDGLDSIQKPLCEMYRKSKWDPKKVFDHMESTLHVFTSGLLMKPCNPLDKDVWFKIQDLDSCSAVKAYNDPKCRGRLLFVPIDSGTASMSEHPAMFALIMKRSSGGVKISDCHAFICYSDSAALTLVRAAARAFSDPSRWTDERPTMVELGLERPEVKFDNECYVDDVKDDCTAEYYDKPKLSGFFYTPRSDLIQKYSVKGEDGFGRPLGEGPEIIQPFTCDEFEPPARVIERPAPVPAPQTAVIVLQNGCADAHCSQQQSSCQSSCLSSCKPVQYGITPQQAQIMYGGNQMGDWRSNDTTKSGKKSSKKDKRQTNLYVQQNEVVRPPVQQYTDPNGDQYIVDAMSSQTGCGDPIYTKFLPQTNGISPQQAQMYGAYPPGDYIDHRQAMQNGMGDYGPPPQQVQYVEYHGPPQNVEYVEYHGQQNNDADLYSRRLPGQGATGKVAGGRNYDGNFMLKKGDGYGMPGGYGMNMGVLSIRDQY